MASSKKNASVAPVAEIRIVERASNANPKLVAEAEIVFGANAGLMAGMKIVGIALWKSDKADGLFVTLPGKKSSEGRFFDMVRPAVGGQGLRRAFTDAILKAHTAHVEAQQTNAATA